MNEETRSEANFLNATGDSFAIYQLRRDEDLCNYRFTSLDRLTQMGLVVEKANYELVYTAPLNREGSNPEILEQLYAKFNLDRPKDFCGHAMSVSDIVALKQDGVVSCHYCDRVGFQEIPKFLQEKHRSLLEWLRQPAAPMPGCRKESEVTR
jgi:hypothetical protein